MDDTPNLPRALVGSVAGFGAGSLGVVTVLVVIDWLDLWKYDKLLLPVFAIALFGPAILVAAWVIRRQGTRAAMLAQPQAAMLAQPQAAMLAQPQTAMLATPAPIPLEPVEARTEPSEEIHAIALARAPVAAKRQSPLLFIALSLFALLTFGRGGGTFEQLVVLVAVLVLHEAGHLAGMRAFGYRDLRMLFVPFIGALASGKKEHAPTWQQATVLLLGPLPGLVLSLVLSSEATSLLGLTFAMQLLFINAFNLLPLLPLDGGRFVRLLFARFPSAQAAFSAVSLLLFIGWSWRTESWLLLGIGSFLLLLVPMQRRIAVEGAGLRAASPSLGALSEIPDDVGRDLYARARRVVQDRPQRPPAIASIMRQVHEQARTVPMARATGAAFFVAYLLGLGLILANLVVLGHRSGASTSTRSPRPAPTMIQPAL